MNQDQLRLLAYLIDTDGRLDPIYARRVFANSVISTEFFYEYDSKRNEFVPTNAAILFDFSKAYFELYQVPPTTNAAMTEIMTRSELSVYEKEAVNNTLLAIGRLETSPNEFDYALDRVLESHASSKALSVAIRGIETLKTDPMGGVEFMLKGMSEVLNYQRVDDLAIERTLNLSQFADYLHEEIEVHGSIMAGSVQYPYSEANTLLGGMAPGELIVIAGPSGVGKSFIGHDIAFHAAISMGVPTVCADREMLHPQNGLRFLSRQTQVPSRKLRNPSSRTPAEDKLIRAALDEYRQLIDEDDPLLFIPPRLCANTAMIRREVDKHWGDKAPKLIIADYLTEFEPTRKREGWEAVKQITHDLKQLALYYACPVVTMAQINRRGEVQYATIKHICDTLILLQEDEEQPYKPPEPGEFIGKPGILHCVVDKARNEAKFVKFSLEVEYATASVRTLPKHGRSAVGRQLLEEEQENTIAEELGLSED